MRDCRQFLRYRFVHTIDPRSYPLYPPFVVFPRFGQSAEMCTKARQMRLGGDLWEAGKGLLRVYFLDNIGFVQYFRRGEANERKRQR